MVRREKQHKPSGGGRDGLDATQGYPSTGSPLVALTAEIQGIITSHVSTRPSHAVQKCEAIVLTDLL